MVCVQQCTMAATVNTPGRPAPPKPISKPGKFSTNVFYNCYVYELYFTLNEL